MYLIRFDLVGWLGLSGGRFADGGSRAVAGGWPAVAGERQREGTCNARLYKTCITIKLIIITYIQVRE